MTTPEPESPMMIVLREILAKQDRQIEHLIRIDKHLDRIDRRLDRLEGSVDRVDERMDSVEQSVRHNGELLTALHGDLVTHVNDTKRHAA